jgi:hypothetical protein
VAIAIRRGFKMSQSTYSVTVDPQILYFQLSNIPSPAVPTRRPLPPAAENFDPEPYRFDGYVGTCQLAPTAILASTISPRSGRPRAYITEDHTAGKVDAVPPG